MSELKPGRELDALVAEKVMGLKIVVKVWGTGKKYRSFSVGEPDYIYSSDRPEGELINSVPRYSTDIAAAWEVVEKLGQHFQLFSPTDNRPSWEARFRDGRFKLVTAEAATGPHAICLAALKAVGHG